MLRGRAQHLLLSQKLWGWAFAQGRISCTCLLPSRFQKRFVPPFTPDNMSKLLVARKAHKRYTSDIRKALAVLGTYNC
jgi:hypothetical protein